AASSATTARTARIARAATAAPIACKARTAPAARTRCFRRTSPTATTASGASAFPRRTSISSTSAFRERSTSKSWSDCGESLGSGEVEVPAGFFARGSTEEVGLPDEHPQRELYLSPFRIDLVPVTFGDFSAFIGEDGYVRRELWSEEGWETRVREGWERPRF